jgi:hypothetical protein
MGQHEHITVEDSDQPAGKPNLDRDRVFGIPLKVIDEFHALSDQREVLNRLRSLGGKIAASARARIEGIETRISEITSQIKGAIERHKR